MTIGRNVVLAMFEYLKGTNSPVLDYLQSNERLKHLITKDPKPSLAVYNDTSQGDPKTVAHHSQSMASLFNHPDLMPTRRCVPSNDAITNVTRQVANSLFKGRLANQLGIGYNTLIAHLNNDTTVWSPAFGLPFQYGKKELQWHHDH
jgi:hypothetical protein